MARFFLVLALLCLLGATQGFSYSPRVVTTVTGLKLSHTGPTSLQSFRVDDDSSLQSLPAVSSTKSATLSLNIEPTVVAMSIGLMFLGPDMAHANQYGIFAGRTASLMHPMTMFALFATSLYSGYLGLSMRRLRGISEEIKEVKNQAPSLSSGAIVFPLSTAVGKVKSEIDSLAEDDPKIATLKNDLSILQSASAIEVDEKIMELGNTRTKLKDAKLKDKHETTGTFILGAGVTVAILGAFNTYMRAGKLFPGPHLYAGMACTILWAIAAAMTPYMAKGNDTARSIHIGLNTINIGLFAWQVVSGIPILLKVIEKTSWP